MEGTILWFNDHKGYGEIETVDGDRFFLTYQDLNQKEKHKTIKADIQVKFNPGKLFLFGWPRAEQVTILEKKKTKSKSRITRIDVQV